MRSFLSANLLISLLLLIRIALSRHYGRRLELIYSVSYPMHLEEALRYLSLTKLFDTAIIIIIAFIVSFMISGQFLQSVFERVVGELTGLLGVFMVLLLTFSIFAQLMFGYYASDFKNMYTAMQKNLDGALGLDNSYEEISAAEERGTFAAIYQGIFYIVMICIFFNILLAVIMSGYSKTSEKTFKSSVLVSVRRLYQPHSREKGMLRSIWAYFLGEYLKWRFSFRLFWFELRQKNKELAEALNIISSMENFEFDKQLDEFHVYGDTRILTPEEYCFIKGNKSHDITYYQLDIFLKCFLMSLNSFDSILYEAIWGLWLREAYHSGLDNSDMDTDVILFGDIPYELREHYKDLIGLKLMNTTNYNSVLDYYKGLLKTQDDQDSTAQDPVYKELESSILIKIIET